jgi:tRNA nucleotidyltransferase/poly(A) polymerase
MSDYLFMLENHLNAEQLRFISELQAACAQSNTNVFLTGGAMRDMLGGFPIRDLDFTVEANAVKMARDLAGKVGAVIVARDDLRKSVEMVLPGGSTVQLAMARLEKYLKPGGKAHVTPSTIHEDLRCRDFTINAIALSLGKASRGLLMDPTNGLADLERRELRAVYNHALYDDPVRLWRLIRFKVRLGFAVEERTQNQYRNARESELEKLIQPRALFEQLRQIASELNPAEVLRALDEEKMMGVVSPALTGPKLNLQGFSKLLKVKQLIPFGIDFKANNLLLFLHLLSEKLTPKERAAMLKAIGIERAELTQLNKLPERARKLEKALKSAKLQKASQVYQVLSEESGELPLFLYMNTAQRLVQDRIRNYLTKYLPAAAEVTDQEIEAEGLKPGTPKFRNRKAEKVAARLDARIRKPSVAAEPEVMVAAAPSRRIL